ncbi:hypothetical protein [Flavobacterium aquidurense]|uniref:hypothetical protein n=1 Tax=Flavobacterium aquidurense TaxID=362413 RepID=UPI00285A8A66|nr:hypothetical protein [Flavobacterium aquidurense]MDR7371054.1 hypothetical protein [Flavobacterium aquidurense]
MMIKTYPLECLDSLILETFDSNNNIKMKSILESDLNLIAENILKESYNVKFELKKEIFCLHKKGQIQLLVRKYHSTIIFLLDNVIENQNTERFRGANLSKIIDKIVMVLDELLSFVQNWFSGYLSLDERVPATYLIVARKELILKLETIKRKKISGDSDTNVMKIVLEILYRTSELYHGNKITYRHIIYQKELLRHLEEHNYSEKTSSIFSSLDHLLINLNFNYSGYINCLIERFTFNLNSTTILENRNSMLLFYFKELNQMQSSDHVMFDPLQQNIKDVLANWLEYEIAYSQKNVKPNEISKIDFVTEQLNPAEVDTNKLECILSTDQMGLILRATDESRIVKAKSMTQVFKTIIPYLSTPFKKDLSYQSVRSKAYHAEERDKQIAIQTLEKIIKKIKTY